MKRLSPQPSGLAGGGIAAALLLLGLVVLVPNLVLTEPGQALMARVQLATRAAETSALDALPDLPFLAQDAPANDEPDNPNATTADAFNRHVARETMAASSRPPKQRAHASGQASQANEEELTLDLGFLEASQSGQGIDLFDVGELTGGPRLPQLDITEGDRTWLSSRRVRHGGFFRRLHSAIARQWDPASALQRRDPSGLLYGTQDRVTVLKLRLSERGYLLEQPRVLKGSGLLLLDQEAVRAVVAAAPFSNPPKALARNGVIDLGRFSFYLEIDRSRFYLRRD